MQFTYRNFQISVFKNTVSTTSQLLISFLPDNVRLGRAEDLACQVDSLVFGSPQTNHRTLENERRLS